MCGITGFIDINRSLKEPEQCLLKMRDTLKHRGPDDAGIWFDKDAGIGLGHRRLSIIELSEKGHQPMVSPNGRYVIVYNGEVYNFREIRKVLENKGYTFKGHSDTEIIISAIETYGLDHAIGKFIGMFAFALWDRSEKKLHLVRDRLGIKPLYYGWIKGFFVFGSELKTIKAFPGFDLPIDRDALALFMRYNYIPAPFSIYKGINKLLPGNILTLSHNKKIEINPFWSFKDIAEHGSANPYSGTEKDAVRKLEELLSDAINLRMISDVPLGAFLSGGIDSSTVTALMQKQSASPVKTFTIGFEEPGYNEANYARDIARHLGTDHTELYVTQKDALDVIPALPSLYDEPFSDSSQIPTFLISKLARASVKVSLSGDGGDELFGGYNRYKWTQNIWRTFGWMPAGVRRKFAEIIKDTKPHILEKIYNNIGHKLKGSSPANKLNKIAEVITAESPLSIYYRLISHWKEPEKIVINSKEPQTILTDKSSFPEIYDFTLLMMYFDTLTYLPDDILTKIDRASMGIGLEARVPLLDHRVVEFAWRLPRSMKIKNRQSKWILRQVLYEHVPKKLFDRPKMGFGVPIDSWLRGDLRDWAESLIDESRLRCEGFLNPMPVREKWREHLERKRNWQYYLWDILMFQAWLEEQNK